jgi:hypothetical protein
MPRELHLSSNQVLFFPAKTSTGKLIVDTGHEGSFSLLIDNLAGQKQSTFEWRLPLTSLTPPKFCPVGKERVEANWKYCPWHGNKLDAGASPVLDPKKKEEKPQ